MPPDAAIVMTLPGVDQPDLEKYEPSIEAVFEGKELEIPKDESQAPCGSPSRSKYFVRIPLPAGMKEGGKVLIKVNGFHLPRRSVDELPVSFSFQVGQDSKTEQIGISTAKVQGGPAVAVLVDVPSAASTNDHAILAASAVDRFGNPASFESREFIIELDDQRPAWPRLTLDDYGNARFELPELAPGVHRFSLIQGEREYGRSGPCLVTDREARGNYLWGDLHSHTGFSDAFTTATPVEALAYARRTAHLDFAAVTDHVEAVWGCSMSGSDWETTVRAAKQADAPPAFTVFLGYEWTGEFPYAKTWPVREGHANLIFPDLEGAPCGADSEQCGSLARLHDFALRNGLILMQHHTIAEWAPALFKLPNDASTPVVEIYSSHGSSECLDCPRAMMHRVSQAGHSVQDALLEGKIFGFVGGGDNHHARPGSRTFPGKTGLILDSVGLTCLPDAKNRRDGIMDSLRKRHSYATTGERIFVDFRVGDSMMGDILPKGSRIRIDYRVHGTDSISKIEILRGDLARKVFESAATVMPDATDAQGVWEDQKPLPKALYYLRATQRNGAMAWSSPIWTSQ
jgi:hypothetical protein